MNEQNDQPNPKMKKPQKPPPVAEETLAEHASNKPGRSAVGTGALPPSQRVACLTPAVTVFANMVMRQIAEGELMHMPGERSARTLRQTAVLKTQNVLGNSATNRFFTAQIQRKCKKNEWQYEHDGCTVPNMVNRLIGARDKDNPAGGKDTHFANREYSGPCDKHDECYQTCNATPTGQKKCDYQMYENMMKVCHQSKEPKRIKNKCFSYARIYYTGLRAFGDNAFQERQLAVCKCTNQSSVKEKIWLIKEILDSWWISDGDLEKIKEICSSSTPTELMILRKAIDPLTTKLTSFRQRTKLRIILSGKRETF